MEFFHTMVSSAYSMRCLRLFFELLLTTVPAEGVPAHGVGGKHKVSGEVNLDQFHDLVWLVSANMPLAPVRGCSQTGQSNRWLQSG